MYVNNVNTQHVCPTCNRCPTCGHYAYWGYLDPSWTNTRMEQTITYNPFNDYESNACNTAFNNAQASYLSQLSQNQTPKN